LKHLIVVTGPCGVGKTSLVYYLRDHLNHDDTDYFDSDQVGLNWHDFKNLENGGIKYHEACIDKAIELAHSKRIVWASCMNPLDFEKLKQFKQLEKISFINLVCDDLVLAQRLKGRPKERNTHHDVFIESQIDYMNWFRKNADKMDWVVDSSGLNIHDTAKKLEAILKEIKRGACYDN
jgi:deoxyadenosine/deoxycytidine kinase